MFSGALTVWESVDKVLLYSCENGGWQFEELAGELECAIEHTEMGGVSGCRRSRC